jgi:hypothetical protein
VVVWHTTELDYQVYYIFLACGKAYVFSSTPNIASYLDDDAFNQYQGTTYSTSDCRYCTSPAQLALL